MEFITNLGNLLAPITQPTYLLYTVASVFVGVYVGAIPGLSATMAASLLISFTFSWDILSAMAVMIGVHVGAVYGGSRSAILLNIPGAPAAIATSWDGYPLALKGQAGRAIGTTAVQSFIGGILGTIVMLVASPAVASVALKFTPRDYLLLALMGLMLVSSLGEGSTWRAIMGVGFGLFIGCIGMDASTGLQRFTFGNTYLMQGVSYITVMIGLFGMSEALMQMRDMRTEAVRQDVSKITPRLSDVFRYAPLTLQCSALGVFVGALPGTGGDIAALLAYDHAKRTVRRPEVPFGQGAMEGIVAPESANNASVPGGYIPLLTLGIPGDTVTAIILGALYIHGLHPGPLLMTQSADVFWFIIGTMFIANLALLACGLTGIKLFAKIVEIPKYILMPAIIILSVVGSYTVNNSVTDIYWMLGFGVIGYFLKLYHVPIGPIILGTILRSLIELNYRRGIAIAFYSVPDYIMGFFTHPLSLGLLIFLVFMIFSQSAVYKKWADGRAEARELRKRSRKAAKSGK